MNLFLKEIYNHKFFGLFVLLTISIIFFWQMFFRGLLPIPSDTITGLYYPFRDAYFKTNPNGLPYKNYLITDPVRQQIPWKMQVIDAYKNGHLPLWNPYNFAGYPLLANFQSGAFYPMNILLLLLPFEIGWSLFIFLQPLLASIFLYLYLRNMRLNKNASILGSVTFAFSGFFISWLEWGSILHTALWISLILLSIDKISVNTQIKTLYKKNIAWGLVFIFSLVSSFFAGHLQSFFYIFLFISMYILMKLVVSNKKVKNIIIFLILFAISLILILPQLLATLSFISLSARSLDLPAWNLNPGWFIPWQNLIQFIAPDFFGNPATLNYYGIWNYGEFIGYVGIIPLIFSIFAMTVRKDKKSLFFTVTLLLSLLFALPTIFAKLPFKLDIPFISTSQPTRLLLITDFSLSILAALGLDFFQKTNKKKNILITLLLLAFIFIMLWGYVLSMSKLNYTDQLLIARNNLLFPTILFLASSSFLILIIFIKKLSRWLNLVIILLILITIVDLFRFGWKFEPFTNKKYLFPSTLVTGFLQQQKGPFRVISSDSTIFPPNFSSVYKIQTLDGYDPLYILRYGELMAASGRNTPDINAPFGFNRIITPQDYLSKINSLLGVKYVLSQKELKNNNLKPVFDDGVIKVYENLATLPRAFFVDRTLNVKNKQEAVNALFNVKNDFKYMAVVEENGQNNVDWNKWSGGSVEIDDYQSDSLKLNTTNTGDGFMVLSDSFYPNWHAKIDGKNTKIYLTNYNFRGIVVPKGNHIIEFYISLF